MCSAELLGSSHQSGTGAPCAGSTQGNTKHSVSSCVFYSCIVSLWAWWLQVKQLNIDRVNAERAIEMRQLKGPVFTIWLLSTAKHLGCIFNEEWEWVYSKRRDWKLWKGVSLFRSNRSPCFSLHVEFGFLALWLCGTVSDRESAIHRLRVSSLVPESPRFLFPSCQSVEIKMKCLAW